MFYEQIPQWELLGTSKEDFQKAKIDVLLNLSYLWVEPKVTEIKERKPKKVFKKRATVCGFCKNNGKHIREFSSHDKKTCPILNAYECHTCGKTGHTVRYCPEKKIITPEEAGMKKIK